MKTMKKRLAVVAAVAIACGSLVVDSAAHAHAQGLAFGFPILIGPQEGYPLAAGDFGGNGHHDLVSRGSDVPGDALTLYLSAWWPARAVSHIPRAHGRTKT